MEESHFSLKWENFYPRVFSSIETLQKNESFVDVTVVCEDAQFKAHKVILSACSSFFCDILKTNPCQHPVIVMNGISASDLGDVLQYIYQGHVSVSSDRLRHVLHVAEMLKIVGLSGCEIGTIPDLNQGEVLEEDIESTYYNSCSSITDTPMRINEDSVQEDTERTFGSNYDKNSLTILPSLNVNVKVENQCSNEMTNETFVEESNLKKIHIKPYYPEMSKKSVRKSLENTDKVRNRKVFDSEKTEITRGSGVYINTQLLNRALLTENPNVAARELFRMLFTEEELSTCTLRRLPVNTDGNRTCLDQNVVNAVLEFVTTIYPATQKQKIVHSLQTLLVKSRKSWLKLGKEKHSFSSELLGSEPNMSSFIENFDSVY